MPKVPWAKIKELAQEQFDDCWRSEEKEMRRIMDAAAKEEKQLGVSVAHVIDCNSDPVTVKTTLSFTEKFKVSKTGSIDDPAQMTLEEAANGKKGKKADEEDEEQDEE